MYIDDNFKDYAKQVCSCSPYQGQCHRPCPHACCPSVTVGATLTGVPGSSARVTNSGTCCRPVLNFEIPRGNTGPAGPTGSTGPVIIRKRLYIHCIRKNKIRAYHFTGQAPPKLRLRAAFSVVRRKGGRSPCFGPSWPEAACGPD